MKNYAFLLPDFFINISAAYFIIAATSLTQIYSVFIFALNTFFAILYYQLAVYFKHTYE